MTRWFMLLVVCSVTPAFGCASAQPVEQHCKHNASLNIDRVHRRYDDYEKSGLQRGTVYWARHDLEVARFVLYEEGGIDGSGAACSAKDRRSIEWIELRDDLETAQQLVRELEDARGVRFDGIESGGRLVWINRESGQPVPQNVANTL